MRTFDFIVIFIFVLKTTISDGSDTKLAVDGHKNDYEDASTEVIERFENIKKSALDKRSYRGLTLRNNLRVILISDPETDKAAACMTICVGGMHDFDELPGIAHFLEHMLFMGSKKYPAENYFSKFVRDHAGIYNGGTSEGWQNYYFDISNQNLAEALDIFAQFFLEPLMDPSTTEREVKAVESEHSMYRSIDGWRLSHLLKFLSKPGHPYSRFFCGNSKSLITDPKSRGIDVRKKLLELHSTWYSSNIMYLAVLGKESLDELEKMVVPLFKNIKNKNVRKMEHTEHPWGPEQLKQKIYSVPISDIRFLLIQFPLPSPIMHYKTAPLKYITELLGHEGSGSLLAELKKRGWSESLATRFEDYPGFSFLGIQIDLTEEAMNHINEIVKLAFQYIHLLKTKGAQEWFFRETQKTSETRFRFKDKEKPMDYVYYVSSSMVDHPFEDVLSHEFEINQWNPKLIEDFLSYLTPANMSILIVSKSFEELPDLQKEPWHDTKYKVEKIPKDLVEEMWSTTEPFDRFHLPPPNEFIVNKFDLHPLDKNMSKHPSLIHESKICQIWFKQDDKFKLPKLFIKLNLFSPITSKSQKNMVLTNLFVKIFNKAFATYGYAASLAELKWNVEPIQSGLHVHLAGYTEKLPALLKKMLSEMKNFKCEEKNFKIVKEAQIRTLKNFANDRPYSQANFYITHLLDNTTYSNEELLTAAQLLQMSDMGEFVKELFARVFVQGLIYGNCNTKLAGDIINIIESSFESASAVLPHEIALPSIVKMDDKSEYIYEVPHKHHESSCYTAYYQLGTEHPVVNTVLTDLFLTIVSEKCFHVLRTEAQLGYVAGCRGTLKHGVIGFLVTVQSDKHPVYVNSQVESFLQNLQGTFENMTETELETYKTALKNIYLQKIVGQDEQLNTYWDEITNRRYHFDRKEAKVEQLTPLKKPEIIDFYKEYINGSSDKRRKLNIHIISNKTNPTLPSDVFRKGNKIESAIDFRNRSKFFPQPHSYMDVPPVGTKI